MDPKLNKFSRKRLFVFIVFLMSTFLLSYCRKNEPVITPKTDTTDTPTDNPVVDATEFSTIKWGTAASAPVATHEVHGEVVNGKLYVFGGYDVNKRPNVWTPTKRAFVYDPVANNWRSIADLPHFPNGPGFGGVTHVGLTNDGTNIYFAGGYPSTSDGMGQVFGTKEVWRYNISSNTYTRLPDLPQALATGQLRYLNGKIHYMGGANLSRQDVTTHLALDLSNLSAGWKSLAPLLNGVNHPGSAVLNGKLYFMGGAHLQDENTMTQKTLEVYNEASNTWTRLADMPTARDHVASSVVTIGDRIIVMGGEPSHNELTNKVTAYSPATNMWTELTPLPVGKSAGVGAVINGNLYYVGGNFATTNYKGVPSGGTTQPPPPPPPTKTTTFSASADAYVQDGSSASKNFGADKYIYVKGSPVNGYTRNTYLKFLFTGMSNVTSAKLRLYGYNIETTSTVNVSCYGVNNDSWTETGIKFNNAPNASTGVLATVGVNGTAKYVEFNVTNFIKSKLTGDKEATLLIKDIGNKNLNIRFYSKENTSNRPQLIITGN